MPRGFFSPAHQHLAYSTKSTSQPSYLFPCHRSRLNRSKSRARENTRSEHMKEFKPICDTYNFINCLVCIKTKESCLLCHSSSAPVELVYPVPVYPIPLLTRANHNMVAWCLVIKTHFWSIQLLNCLLCMSSAQLPIANT